MSSASIPTQAFALIASLIIAFAAAAVGAVATVDAGSFYASLARPSWAPPGWAFGPVWTVLYLLMAVAAWLVWQAPAGRACRLALTLFIVQLAANALWSWLFFAWRSGAAAFAEVLLLLALIAATIAAFWRLRPLAGVLMLPYLAWVSFATALTWAVWQDNPDLL